MSDHLNDRRSRSHCADDSLTGRVVHSSRGDCAKCGQDNPDGFRFCGACGAALTTASVSEERKVVTVLFADLVGFTSRSERMDVEDVRGTLAPYHALLREQLEHYGGTVEKFIGDAVMALFGAPVAHEDDPERAVRAALSIRAAIGRLNDEEPGLDLHVRVGVNTGEALVVLGADTARGEGMASGDVVNTAARLQSAAPVDGILVGETHLSRHRPLDHLPQRRAGRGQRKGTASAGVGGRGGASTAGCRCRAASHHAAGGAR